ncbi:RNA-guided endonuclease InsQ/TnpB family protein [Alkalibacterium sp.]|uniref:RNA-guided endonuclease InsQ/TnpB family protein n=1 Tax=Alkalibacterium sp. TaxID=1872447 RepID=UPI003970C1B7
MTVVDNHYIRFPKLKQMKCHGAHRITGKIKRATIHKNPSGSYTATILVEDAVSALPKTGAVVGLDMGITHLVIQSDDYKLPNKQFERALAQKKRVWQRKFARRRAQAIKTIEQSNVAGVELKLSDFRNVEKAKQQVARINRKIANQRNDYLHQYTTHLVKTYDVIVMEDLKTKNLMANHHLARSIADASWGIIKTMLTYKCTWYKKELILVNPHYTSQLCAHCGENTGKKPLHVRIFDCPHCGTCDIDRDINAAINIRNKAFA